MKKKIACSLVFLFCYGFCTAQQVVSAGGYALKSEVSVNWILGGNLSGISALRLGALNMTGTEVSTESLITLKAYPNPTSDFINLEITPVDTGRINFELFNSSGAKLLSKIIGFQPVFQVNLSDIPSGAYFLKVSLTTNDQLFKIEKIIKK